MKKIIYSILFLSSISFAQTEKSVGDFNKVTSFDKIDVLLLPGTENKVIFGGRLGEYKYYDMDQVIAAALNMAEKEL